MKATLEKVFGYQGDNMNLPVPDLTAGRSRCHHAAGGADAAARDNFNRTTAG